MAIFKQRAQYIASRAWCKFIFIVMRYASGSDAEVSTVILTLHILPILHDIFTFVVLVKAGIHLFMWHCAQF